MEEINPQETGSYINKSMPSLLSQQRRALEDQHFRILLIEDDEDDYVLFRDIVAEIELPKIKLDWVDSYHAGLETAKCDEHDIYVIDYRLHLKTGLELLQEIKNSGCLKPVILLTGVGDRTIDFQAMRKGVSDYIEKDKLTPYLLERTFRYAYERYKVLNALYRSKRQLRFLSEKLIETQELERQRIAKELHDSIGSSLTAIKFSLEKKRRDALSDGATAESEMTPLIDMTKHAIEDLRRIYSELRPLILDDMGILTAIKWYCRKFKEIYSHLHIEYNLTIEEHQVPEMLKIVIYRILQEALNNTSKHSNADQVQVALTQHQKGVLLSITDNGQGFDVGQLFMDKKLSKGIGLLSMKERTEFAGGEFVLTSHCGQGTKIKAFWPFS